MTNPTFDPAKVNLVVGGQLMTGFMDGTFITASKDEDDFMPFTGVKGETAVTRNRNETGKIVFVLMMTSPANDLLSAMRQLHLNTGVPPGAVRLSDVLGTTEIAGEDSYIAKPAEVKYSKDFEGREWTVIVPKMRYFVGGAVI